MSITAASNFTDFEKEFFITEAVIPLTSLSSGLLYVADNHKQDQYTFPTMTASPVFNPRALTPTDNSTTVLGNKVVTLGAFEAYEVFDPSVFENHWHHDQLTKAMLDRGLPATFESYLGAYYTKKVLARVETGIYMSSLGYTTTAATAAAANWSYKYYDGLVRQAVVNATQKVASPVALTSANIIAKMEAAKALVPRELLSLPNRYDVLKYVMSVEDFQKYEDALTNTTYKNNDTTERSLTRYKGYSIVVTAGIPENTFFLYQASNSLDSNAHCILNAYQDMSFEVNRLQNNSSAMFYKLIMKMGVGIAKFNEFVVYTTKVAADFTA